jgi:hypothetical protein
MRRKHPGNKLALDYTQKQVADCKHIHCCQQGQLAAADVAAVLLFVDHNNHSHLVVVDWVEQLSDPTRLHIHRE